MAGSFFADVQTKAITDLSPEWLRSRGIALMLLDFDNTVVPYSTDEPTETFSRWLEAVRASGVTVAVVSNSRKERVRIFCDARDIPCIVRAKKPSPRGILEAMARFGGTPAHTALAGDQTFTDVLAANRAGVTSVLVRPVRFSNPFFVLRYVVELPFIGIGRLRRKR